MSFIAENPVFLSGHRVAETGNTGVTPADSTSIVKERDPSSTGVTSKIIDMAQNTMTALIPSVGRGKAARAAMIFAALLVLVVFAMPASSKVSAGETTLQAVFGSVVAVTPPDVLVVATNSGVVKLVINADSKFTGDITSVDHISEGDRVVATAYQEADGSLTVARLLVIPDLSQAVTRHILGVIIDATDGVVTLQDGDGNTITIYVPEGVIVPEIGTVVTVVVQVDRSTGILTAQAFELAEDAVQRLQDAKDRTTDSERKKDLEERLERARDQHLTVLEKAREALQRAQQAVSAAVSEREEAQRRLAEVQAKFEALRQRYVQEASDRNERSPQLLITGTLTFDESTWLDETGTFTVVQSVNAASANADRSFAWDENTLAIVPVEIKQPDGESPAITTTVAQSVAIALNDVKSLIPSGSRVTVQYDPNVTPALATLVTVLPPELSAEARDALERERVRSISGVVTLVDATPELKSTVGVIVVANNEHSVKVAAKVTEQTEVVIDGQPSTFSQLAAGMAVEVDFSVTQDADGSSPDVSTAESGNRTAVSIRARIVVDAHEVYVAGVIVGLNVETRHVVILPRSGDVVRVRVVDEAVIVKDGDTARFGELSLGDLVLDATRYNDDTMVLTRLLVRSPGVIVFSGRITGLGHNPDRLTVATSEGDVLTSLVTDETIILGLDGAPARFNDLSIGDRVAKGYVQPVVIGGRTVNVARDIVLGQSAVATARGKVLKVDPVSGYVRVSVNAEATDGVAADLDLFVADRDRSVLMKNGERIDDLSTVLVGDVVEAVSYTKATKIILKMSVATPNLQRVRGSVNVVASSGLVIEGSTGRFVGLSVNQDTQITLNGVRVESLKNVKPTQIVVEATYIARSSDLAQGLALRIVLVDRPPMPGIAPPATGSASSVVETTVSGVIEEIEGSSWQIDNHKFMVTGETQFFGERPQVGLVAKATLRVNDSGEFVATAVSVAGRPDSNPTSRPADVQPTQPGDTPGDGNNAGLVRILGKVQKIDRSGSDQLVVVIDGVKILIVSTTVIVGEPVEGVTALAVVRRNASGSVTAVTIAFGRSGDASSVAPASPEPSTEADSGGDSSDDSDRNAPEYKVVTITIEQVSGRVVLADGDLYWLTAAQVRGLAEGDELTVKVRSVRVEDVATELSVLDRAALAVNPLYKERADDSGKLYVAD